MQLSSYLAANAYPGRGIVLGRSADNRSAVIAYFIMGRSENSRNRIFVTEEDGIRTQAYDTSKMTDPSLILYHPVRRVSDEDGLTCIVTNGDQTDTIRDYMLAGEGYIQALNSRKFEPDTPNYTPRISGILYPRGAYVLSILKSMEGDPSCCIRSFFTYDRPKAGVGHLIHTYEGDGVPLPSFTGEPRPVCIGEDQAAFTRMLWENLNKENKVSLYTAFVDLESGAVREQIINKHN